MRRNFVEDSVRAGFNNYSLVIAVAKLARQIVENSNQLEGICPDDPVGDAIESLNRGDVIISND